MIPDKFKAGEYVYVSTNLKVGSREDGLYVIPQMTTLGNKKMQIVEVVSGVDRYRLKGLGCYFSSDMFHRKQDIPLVNVVSVNPLPKL